MSRLHEAFAQARAEDRAALVGYLPAGFPDDPQADVRRDSDVGEPQHQRRCGGIGYGHVDHAS